MRHRWHVFPALDHRVGEACRQTEAAGYRVQAILPGGEHGGRIWAACVVGRKGRWPWQAVLAPIALVMAVAMVGPVSVQAQPPFLVYGYTGSVSRPIAVDSNGNLTAVQSGTWTVQQGTPPWTVDHTKTGGTAISALTAASTGSEAGEPVRPIVTRRTATGSLSAACANASIDACGANSTVALTVDGYAGAAVTFVNTNLAGTLMVDWTVNGTHWTQGLFVINATSGTATVPPGGKDLQVVVAAGTTFAELSPVFPAGVTQVRLRCGVFTSGASGTNTLSTNTTTDVFGLSLTGVAAGRAVSAANIGVVGGSDGGTGCNILGIASQPCAQAVNATNGDPSLTAYGFAVRLVGPSTITLQASQVSGIAATTTTRTTTTGLSGCKMLEVYINITAAGTATGTLQLFLEDSADSGTSWNDLISDTAFTFGAAVRLQRYAVQGDVTPQTMTAATLAALAQGAALTVEAPPVAAPYARQGPFGDRIRVREKVSAPAGSPVGPTYTITAVCK